MKNQEELLKEISDLQTKYERPDDFSDKELNAARKRITVLRQCIYYLDSDPRPEFIIQMQSEANHRLSVLENRLELWKQSIPADKFEKIKNPRTYYYKEVAPSEQKDMKEAKFHIETLNYLLS